MNMLDALTPMLIGIFFLLLAVVQYRWGAEQPVPRLLNTIFVWCCGVYGFVILYGVVRGAM